MFSYLSLLQNVRMVSLRCIHALSRFPVHEVKFRMRSLVLNTPSNFKIQSLVTYNQVKNKISNTSLTVRNCLKQRHVTFLPLVIILSHYCNSNHVYFLSVFQILPFRARVLRALARPLDDKKRMVRSEAVQARGEW